MNQPLIQPPATNPTLTIGKPGVLDPEAYWTCGIIDGRMVEHTSGQIHPTFLQRQWAREMAQKLAPFHHDGRWQIVWYDPTLDIDTKTHTHVWGLPTELAWVFKDADGDIIVCVQSDDRVEELYRVGFDRWIEDCESGYKQARGIEADAEVRPEQKIKRHQGQRPKDASIVPPY